LRSKKISGKPDAKHLLRRQVYSVPVTACQSIKGFLGRNLRITGRSGKQSEAANQLKNFWKSQQKFAGQSLPINPRIFGDEIWAKIRRASFGGGLVTLDYATLWKKNGQVPLGDYVGFSCQHL
jgi:hypothetical protein